MKISIAHFGNRNVGVGSGDGGGGGGGSGKKLIMLVHYSFYCYL